jgi:5-oxoprolinase (ATP-hydrolysing) subunit C
MAPKLHIVKAGLGTTIQDQGRRGYLRFGVTIAGPMDWISHARANLLAGNPEDTGAIEVGIGGIELEVEGGPVVIGYAGAPFETSRNGRALPVAGRVRLETGDRMAVRPGARGAWFYLSVAGGLNVAPVMGSLATSLRTGIGPAPLAPGDVLAVNHTSDLPDVSTDLIFPDCSEPIRVVLGPQDDCFSACGLETFLGESYRVSQRSDRMGYRLEGTKIEHLKGFNIVSDAIALGAIQVPGDGLPIVLMADHQPTGGYPKLAHVIRADIGRLAQCRPGDVVRFVAVSVEEARNELIATTESLRDMSTQAVSTEPDLTSERLLALNLISGVGTAFDQSS